jgi:hypothetical protein
LLLDDGTVTDIDRTDPDVSDAVFVDEAELQRIALQGDAIGGIDDAQLAAQMQQELDAHDHG